MVIIYTVVCAVFMIIFSAKQLKGVKKLETFDHWCWFFFIACSLLYLVMRFVTFILWLCR